MNKIITWLYKFKPNRFSSFGEVTFVEHERGWWGSVVFCNINRGGIHLNAISNRAQRSMDWFVENIDRCLSHETLHLIISRFEGPEASRRLDRVDTYFGENLSEFSRNSEELK